MHILNIDIDINHIMVYIMHLIAGIAQLVEHKLPKLGVASSNLVARSRIPLHFAHDRLCFMYGLSTLHSIS